jgi:hypothetical protein
VEDNLQSLELIVEGLSLAVKSLGLIHIPLTGYAGVGTPLWSI